MRSSTQNGDLCNTNGVLVFLLRYGLSESRIPCHYGKPRESTRLLHLIRDGRTRLFQQREKRRKIVDIWEDNLCPDQ